jgi:hypothetical protein
VEFPVGVGFPYNNIAFDLTILEDHFVGEFSFHKIKSSNLVDFVKVSIFNKLLESTEDAYKLWMNWLQRFPQFKGIFHSKRKLCK